MVPDRTTLVAAEGITTGAVNWIDRQLNLWNVAITRARSHLIVVGDATYWRRRQSIAADLLAAADESTQDLGETPTTELLKRLYQKLSEQKGSTVTLGQHVNGHPADAIVHQPDNTSSAILLDTGPEDDSDPTRHLRLMLRRASLMSSTEDGRDAERYPAWKLYDTDRD